MMTEELRQQAKAIGFVLNMIDTYEGGETFTEKELSSLKAILDMATEYFTYRTRLECTLPNPSVVTFRDRTYEQ